MTFDERLRHLGTIADNPWSGQNDKATIGWAQRTIIDYRARLRMLIEQAETWKRNDEREKNDT